MSPSLRRSEPSLPDFDPYGYSPFDAQFKAQNETAAQYNNGYDDQDYRRRASMAGYPDDYDRKAEYGHRRSNKTSASRKSSRVRDDYPRDQDDGWETDYDPMDKYYLSGDDPIDRSPTRRHSKDDYRPKSARKNREGISQRHHHPSQHHGSTKSRSGHPIRNSLPRRDSSERSTHRHHSHHSSASPSSRPKAMSRNSSYGGRPRAITRHSSYGGRPRSMYPPNSSRSKGVGRGGGGPGENPDRGCWEQATKAALKAGAIAALKVSTQRGSFVDKGTKVASAALGAAAVDALLTKKKPDVRGGKRHTAAKEVAEMAIGLLVAKPAMKGIHHRRPMMRM